MISVSVTEASQVADVRRQATTLAKGSGFGETAAGRVAIVATELATNLVKYGSQGAILVGTYEDDTGAGIELVALDKGTGMANVADALRDGHSTGGSAGTGLGSVRRQSHAFDIASWPDRGTAVLARIQADAAGVGGSSPIPFCGGVAIPMAGESICGDAYCARRQGSGWTILMADGLGHGPNAALAADEAVRLFRKHEHEAPGTILSEVHAGLRATRGAAVSVAHFDPARSVLVFSGIGNVAGVVLSGGETKRMVSLAGTAGHVARRIQEFEYPFPAGSLLAMHSDGIGTNWSLDRYPGLIGAHPSLIAGILYRDFSRGRDDATVLVAGQAR